MSNPQKQGKEAVGRKENLTILMMAKMCQKEMIRMKVIDKFMWEDNLSILAVLKVLYSLANI